MEMILFYILAVIAVASALLAITRINPLASALWLILCLLSIGGLFGLLAAPVVALFQILLAAGAIMVLVVFVVMLTNLDPRSLSGREIKFGKILGAFAAGYLVVVTLVAVMKPPYPNAPMAHESYSAPSTLGKLLVHEYFIPFELVSILLLIAMVSAVVMGRRHDTRC